MTDPREQLAALLERLADRDSIDYSDMLPEKARAVAAKLRGMEPRGVACAKCPRTDVRHEHDHYWMGMKCDGALIPLFALPEPEPPR